MSDSPGKVRYAVVMIPMDGWPENTPVEAMAREYVDFDKDRLVVLSSDDVVFNSDIVDFEVTDQDPCPHCGFTGGSWFSRTIQDFGFGEQMHDFCSSCGGLFITNPADLWERIKTLEKENVDLRQKEQALGVILDRVSALVESD